MSAPSVTLRSLQNEETGIDISVPRFQEEEAPLGGISILYEISVLTSLDLFKTRLHRNEDVVQFSVYKAYREMEDLYKKLNKKYPKAGLPPLPEYSTIDKYSSEEKVVALDRFMKAVAKNVELCHSSTFTHFIGINSHRLPSFTVPSSSVPKVDLKSEIISSERKVEKVVEDLSEVFPKVNILPKGGSKPLQSVPVNENIDLFEEVKLVKESEEACNVPKSTSTGGLFDYLEEDDGLFNPSQAVPRSVTSPKQVKKVEDVKPKRKEPEVKSEEVAVDDSQIIIKDRKLGDISLFDEQDLGDYVTKDDKALFLVSSKSDEKTKNSLLFSSKLESTEPESELHEDLDDLLKLNPLPISPKKPESTSVPEKQTLPKEECVTDASETQPKRPVPLPRKKSLGKIDAFEQTTALPRPEVMPRKVFLTKPEQNRYLKILTTPTDQDSVKLVEPTNQDSVKLAKPTNEDSLKLAEPTNQDSVKPTRPTNQDSMKPAKLTNQDSVKPAKPTNQDSVRPAKPPPISAKPTVPSKPKPPPKAPKPTMQKATKDLDAINANKPQKQENQTTVSTIDDLNKLDILQYIEQEQKALDSEPSLFD